ncbi:hypothetical protein CEXT_105011, partial [Caerostris extrusa]
KELKRARCLLEIEKRIRRGPIPYRQFDGGMDQVSVCLDLMWVEKGSQLSPSDFGDLIVYVQNEPKRARCLLR